MKLSKHTNGYYYVHYKSASGKWMAMSTKSRDKTEAKRIASEAGIAELEQAGQVATLTSEVVGRITSGKRITIAAALEEFGKWLRVGRSAKTAANTISTVAAWAKWSELSDSPPSQANEIHVNTWINRLDPKVKLGTRKIARSAISSFFDFCSVRGWSTGNPARLVRIDMNSLTWQQKEPKQVQAWTGVEYTRLRSYLHKRGERFWEAATFIAYHFGLRLGDICQLEWDCFSKPHAMIVWTDKRDKRVELDIQDSALEQMITSIPITHPRLIFPEQSEMVKDPKRRAQLSVQFARHCKKAGVPNKTFHAFRHTRISAWKKEGKSLESIGKLVGHSSTKTTEGYVHE